MEAYTCVYFSLGVIFSDLKVFPNSVKIRPIRKIPDIR